ncbi:MAG: hypothetical protein COB37_11130 [Kordiimonadales bacterium]|nr:MAG: hypothetical protein COB37_11130 [Kordiimonadales bacterium]
MPQKTLSTILIILGLAAVLIAVSIFAFGPDATAQAAAALNALVLGPQPVVEGFQHVNVDNELRFYSVYWFAYGCVLIATGGNLSKYLSRVPYLAAIFFASGVGRIVSYYSVGAPQELFTSLMGLELALPVLMAVLWRQVVRQRTSTLATD